MGFLERVRKVLFPENLSCIVCNVEMAEGESSFNGVCKDCESTFTRNNREICACCGSPVTDLSLYCLSCTEHRPFFDNARSALIFDGGVKHVVHRFKFGGCRWLKRFLAPYLQEECYTLGQFDVIIPVPIARRRLKKRGYNQSAELAIELSSLIDVPTNLTVLKKVMETQPQSKLTRAQRVVNLEGAYEIDMSADLKGKRVLLVDDILTTGTTLSECARLIKKLKPHSVCAVVVATPPYGAKND